MGIWADRAGGGVDAERVFAVGILGSHIVIRGVIACESHRLTRANREDLWFENEVALVHRHRPS